MIIDFATDDLRRSIKELSGSTGGDASGLAPVSALPTSAETGKVVALYKEEVPLPEYIRFEERDDLGENNDKTGGRFYFPFRCGEGYTSGNPLYIGSVSTDDEHSYDITLYTLDNEDLIYVNVVGFAGVVNGYGADDSSISRDGLTFMSHEPVQFGDDGMLDFYPTTSGSVSFVLNESEEQLGVYQYDGTTWNEIGSGGYILPVASETTLGGVMIGSGLSITQDGKISVSGVSAEYAEEAGSAKLLEGSNSFPESAETGDVVSVNIEGQMGVYQYDGTDWNQLGTGGSGGSQNYIILDDLTGTGEEGQLYSYHNRLMRWVSGTGRWGKWIISMDANAYNAINDIWNNNGLFGPSSYLAYTNLPFTGTQVICKIMCIASNAWLGYFPSENKLKTFDNSSLTGTPIAEISMNGVEVQAHASSNRKMFITWTDGLIKFRSSDGWAKMAGDYVSTAATTGHFEALDVDYFDGTSNFDKTAGAGFAVWNSEGKVVAGGAPNAKAIYLNTTGNTSRFDIFYVRQSNVPDRWFFPTEGGTAGQVLTSTGNNSAPSWATLIKAVKITSDAYEALVQAGTTDPNTLYLIVDE